MPTTPSKRASARGDTAKPKRTAAQLADAAEGFMQIGEYQICLYLCDLATAEDVREAFSHFVRGCCLNRMGFFEEAAEALMCAAALKPERPDIQFAYAKALDRAGRLEMAYLVYTRVLELDRTRLESLLARAIISQRLCDFKSALVDLNRYLELCPNAAGALVNRGMCYLVAGDRERADVDFEQAIGLDYGQCERIKQLTDGL